jgi:PAS domain S-box-containing protein
LFDNAYDAILILDPKGRILRANKILYHKLGYTEDELLGKTPSLFDTPKFAELVPSRMLQVAEFGVAFFESEHVAKDGMIYPVEISCRAIELGGNTVFMGIARDISERKRMELSLRQALEDAETANATMKRLLNTVAHEFRTPLSLITSSIDILNCYSDRLTKEQRAEQNDYIRSAAHQMRELINSILSFNIMEPNENIQEPELLNISQYCRTIASEVCSIYKMEEYFNINISENCGTAKLNKTLFRRILENLLTNAFKYTPLGGTVSLSIDCENKRLVIMIADSGIGIASKDKQHIFDSFYRGQNVEDRRGLGLGLSIVHDALSQMGGAIHVDSTIGEGTAIKVDLPVDDLSCCEEEIHVLNSDN